jgi:hypothetical protein
MYSLTISVRMCVDVLLGVILADMCMGRELT